MWEEFGYCYEAIKDRNYDQLIDWFFKEYIPNCWMQHSCQNCDHILQLENLKTKTLNMYCDHGIQYMQDSVSDLEIYKFIPKGIIQHQCEICNEYYNQINEKHCQEIQDKLISYGLWLFNQDKKIDCLFRHLNEQILLKAYKLSQKTQKQVLQFIKLWKFQQNNRQDALLFEKYFHQFTTINNIKDNNDQYKLDIICKFKQCFDIEPIYIQQASLSENYLAYIIKYQYLYVYDIKKDNIILIKCFFKKIITQCLFSDDGTQLYISFTKANTIILDAQSTFQKTNRLLFCEENAQTTNITNLKYKQILVGIQKHYGTTNKYIHFDVRRNKLVAVYRKLSKKNIDLCSYDNTNNCILHVTQSDLTVLSMVNRSVIYNVEMNDIRYMFAFGGNHILELDKKFCMNLLSFNQKSLCFERQLIQENVENFYCTNFQQYWYKQFGNAQWIAVSQNKGSIYSVEQTKYHDIFTRFNIGLGNKFLINDHYGLRLLIME